MGDDFIGWGVSNCSDQFDVLKRKIRLCSDISPQMYILDHFVLYERISLSLITQVIYIIVQKLDRQEGDRDSDTYFVTEFKN